MTDFIGAGWAFPMSTDATGGVALVTREREIEQAIRIVLATSPGERPMRPEFGCRISDHVFGAVNAGTAGMLAYEVRRSLERWEPRIDVEDVRIGYDRADPAVVYIDVRYVIRATNDPRNLVFPFYAIPAEPDVPERGGVQALPSAPAALTDGRR